jgi:hypothetical protein
MGNRRYAHERYFRSLYASMMRRLEKYKAIQEIGDGGARKEAEGKFLSEQKKIITKFINQEASTRKKLKEGLTKQQKDVEGLWNRNITFRRVKSQSLHQYDILIAFAQKVREILDKDQFDNGDSLNIIAEIEDELKTITRLSDDYEIKKYEKNILRFCKRNKRVLCLTILFVMVSSLAVYMTSNSHIVPQNTQGQSVGFALDDMNFQDWAAGRHSSYGFHTMVDRIVKHKSSLKGLAYKGFEDTRYGNKDANILEISTGASALLPKDMKKELGDNIQMEVQALNKGDVVIIIRNPHEVVSVYFTQDGISHVTTNTLYFSNELLLKLYHSVRRGITHRVNTNS